MVRKAWRRLGKPEAIGWPVGVVFFPQLFFGSFAAPMAELSGRFVEFTGARVVSILTMIAVLVIGRLILELAAKNRPQPVITLLVIAATIVSGTVVQNGLLILLDFTDNWNVGLRLVVAGPGIFTLLTLSCLVVASARDSARQNNDLAGVAQRLLSTRRDAVATARQRRDELVVSVRDEVAQALSGIDTGQRSTLQHSLNSLLDDVVRPLSFRLATGIEPSRVHQAMTTTPKIVWRSVFRSALAGNPAHPNATTLWLAILVGVFLSVGFGAGGLLAASLLALTAWLSLSLLRRCWPTGDSRHLPWRALLYSTVVVAYSSVSAVIITAVSAYDLLIPHIFIGFLLLSTSMAWTISLVYGLHEQLEKTHQQLEATVDDLQREIIALNSGVRSLQRRLSRALHGPIQSALVILIQRLEKRNTGDVADEMERFRENLENVLAQAESHNQTEPVRFDDALAEVVEFWDDVAQIRVSVDDRVQSALRETDPCSRVLIELIREACGNAIKHATARFISVTVGLDTSHDALSLVVDNDGQPLRVSAQKGVGGQIFDESCLRWGLSQHGDLVRLEALIPLCEPQRSGNVMA